MDTIVEQALLKWPNVPHCYGWLGLDARGVWRMRNEAAQRQNLAGEKIVHPALIGFINRNYTHDAQGRWYFQNGPQRVYIDLECAPYVAHTEPGRGFVLHTGATIAQIEAAWLSREGHLYLQGNDGLAVLDDRDMAQCVAQLQLDGRAVSDEALLAWLDISTNDAAENAAGDAAITLQWQGCAIPLRHISDDEVAAHFGFVCSPRPSD